MSGRVLTSNNCPIEVQFIPKITNGRLGMTFAPGKKYTSQWTGLVWSRDLIKDLARLKQEYKCNHLVSLMEHFEYEMVLNTELFTLHKEHEINLIHFPIADWKVPTSAIDFCKLVESILGYLEKEEIVIIHCLGGKGRTGVVAACCLLALCKDMTTEDAITIIRDTRKGTIQSDEQLQFVLDFPQVWKKFKENL